MRCQSLSKVGCSSDSENLGGRGSSVATSASTPSEARPTMTSSTMELEVNSAAFQLDIVELPNNIVGVLRTRELNNGVSIGLALFVSHNGNLDGTNLVLLEELL